MPIYPISYMYHLSVTLKAQSFAWTFRWVYLLLRPLQIFSCLPGPLVHLSQREVSSALLSAVSIAQTYTSLYDRIHHHSKTYFCSFFIEMASYDFRLLCYLSLELSVMALGFASDYIGWKRLVTHFQSGKQHPQCQWFKTENTTHCKSAFVPFT